MKNFIASACAVLSLFIAGASVAQSPVTSPADYPNRVVRIVVPYPAGGGTDAMARVVATHLSARWGQPVIVENRPGAAGNLGLEMVSKSPADGYTLVMMPSNHSINPSLFGKLNFDPIKSFTPVVVVATSPIVLAANTTVPAKTFQELLPLLRSNPTKYSYASCGNGTPQHLAGELLKSVTKLDQLTHVPYKGCAPAVVDFVGGSVPISFSTLANLSGHIKSGKVNAIAVTGKRRSSLAPELPTIAESGLPNYDMDVWFGLLAPANLPPGVLSKINTDVNEVLGNPELKEKLLGQFFEVLGGTPQQFATLIKTDLDRLGKLIRDNNIKVD